jgi:acetyl esterase/lipase
MPDIVEVVGEPDVIEVDSDSSVIEVQTPDITLSQYSLVGDTLALARVERQARQKLDNYNRKIIQQFSDCVVTTELWANTSAWTGTGSVVAGQMYGSTAGLAKALVIPAGGRRMIRFSFTITAGKYVYCGVNSDTAAAVGSANNGFYVGISNNIYAQIKGANVTGTSSNSITVAAPSGVYITTVFIDEETVSISVAPAGGGQFTASTSIKRSQMPGGAINSLIISNGDATGAGGTLVGPVTIMSDSCPPPIAQQSPGGVPLFDANKPICINRIDPATGIRHLIMVPGQYDPRTPMPVVLWCHQAATGTATGPYVEARWASIMAACKTSGYILVSSDNGTASTGASPYDKFGNQIGVDDYSAAIEWTRKHFNTGALFLFGTSQGGAFVQQILASRLNNSLGNIAGVASISPAIDLRALDALPPFQAAAWLAWGANSTASYMAAILGKNPIQYLPPAFRGVAQRFYVALDDTTTPKTVNIDPMVAKLTGYAPETGVVTVATGGHLADALYNASDIIAFFDRYKT